MSNRLNHFSGNDSYFVKAECHLTISLQENELLVVRICNCNEYGLNEFNSQRSE